ncbi:Protein of unknown function [Kaistella jeonii]|nr:Protein of unknown function [Kaistella jeonii]VEI95342.1 Uncharacterised protein [Kaistella jeonii]
MNRHEDMKWEEILIKLEKNPEKLESLRQMEESGGEADVIKFDEKPGEYHFYDCAVETPKRK